MSNNPLELLKNGQLLSVANSPDAGVILQKKFFAEFVGPGSAIGGMFDVGCVKIYTLGQGNLNTPSTLVERQQAFHRRIEDIEMMQKLCQVEAPLQRSIDLLEMLCDRFSLPEVRKIPNDVLAKTVGVFPHTIIMAWQQRFNVSSPTDNLEDDGAWSFATIGA
jgi:hypothetical protein